MPTEDIVRWLRGEHDNAHELADRLRESVVKAPRGSRARWIEQLRSRFDDYAGCIRRRMAHEEERDYLKPVVQARPSLLPFVDVLKNEHTELARLIDNVQRAVHRLSERDNLLLRDCCKRIDSLLACVERHEEHENHIVIYALADDIRTGS